MEQKQNIAENSRFMVKQELQPWKEEEVPSKNDLEKVLYAPISSSRARASIAIIALSGCKLEVQDNREGNDGLRIDDLPDLRITHEEGNQKGVVFNKIPARVVVRPSLSKTGRQYFTYLPEEGCEILKQHYLTVHIRIDSSLSRSLNWIISES